MNHLVLKKQLLFEPKLILSVLIFYQNFNTKAIYSSYTSQKDNEDRCSQEKLHLYKSKGQHLLTNPRVLDTIVRRSAVEPTDTVLEIGPGTGNLTLRLLEVARKVVAVEIDKRMVEILRERASEQGLQDKLDIIHKDALKAEFPNFNIVVANIPYGISSPLVTKLVYGVNKFRSLTLLLQKEFARRLLANPGDPEYNRLAVNVKLVADVEFVMDVSKRDFVPSPKVDSSVVIIRPKTEIPSVNLVEWRAFTRTCFGNKNKTLGAIFKQKKKVMELLRMHNMTSCNSKSRVNANDDDDDDHNHNENSDGEGEGGHFCSCSEMEVSFYKERIIEVLKANGFEGNRPSKLSNKELVNLLSLLNQAGVFFT
ncbi:ribosomal RNA small subunit methyltransferase, mitochondrial [Ricinus communis]|uniref:rRNA adenine N(6)-methyltransferase n=1 Tax=Ricinus communis TaxID=3988 RepID=B9S682_RICCO|nr:ribosomal RNA small subunit methyltransferase, mitochondrial [Ricinus communis]EEF40772.1 dimethyladenosine transferase, putative [Ricinus communis]|eukprot:XP_002521501.1 ribosomal RNA small subunit methyltransferase, mitochondrial [Ricinus communis]